MTERQGLVEQVRLCIHQRREPQLGVAPDGDGDNADPEPRHRVVVAVAVPMVGGKTLDHPRYEVGCMLETRSLNLHPCQPQMIAVMEALVRDLAAFERRHERFVVGRDQGLIR